MVKSHGSADRLAFANALARAASEVRHGLNERIAAERAAEEAGAVNEGKGRLGGVVGAEGVGVGGGDLGGVGVHAGTENDVDDPANGIAGV